jgi:hypothetical protein
MRNHKKDLFCNIEMIVNEAHEICGDLLLFEAISMQKPEIELFLDSHNITDKEIQTRYLHLVEKYDRSTGCKNAFS